MSAFTINPIFAKDQKISHMQISSEKYHLEMKLSCYPADHIAADDDTGNFMWESIGYDNNGRGILLRLHENGFVIEVTGDSFQFKTVFPADSEDFKQLLRDVMSMLPPREKHWFC